MSFSYNNETWYPRLTADHAANILEETNKKIKENGSTQQIKAVSKNILWLLMLAVGEMLEDNDLALYGAQTSLDPSLCDDEQLLNLALIAGTSLRTGTYTTVTITLTATSEGDCVIPVGSKMYLTSDIYFDTQEEVTIPAGTSDTFVVYASERGPITVTANQLTSFSTTIDYIQTITSAASVPGQADETYNELRARLVKGQTLSNTLDAITLDLKSISGITDAKIYFNPDPSVTLTLPGSIDILPRTVRIYLAGTVNDPNEVAFTYWQKANIKTEGSLNGLVETRSGQQFQINFDMGEEKPLYVKLYKSDEETISEDVESAAKDLILNAQTNTLGALVTAGTISQLFKDFTGFTLIDCELSDDDITYTNYIVIGANEYATFSSVNISIEDVVL